MSSWECEHCSQRNFHPRRRCQACKVKLRRCMLMSEALSQVSCPSCSFLKSPSSQVYDVCVCGTSKVDAVNDEVISWGEDGVNKEEENDPLYLIAEKHFGEFSVETLENSTVEYHCSFDRYVCRTKKMMCLYLLRFYKDKLKEYADGRSEAMYDICDRNERESNDALKNKNYSEMIQDKHRQIDLKNCNPQPNSFQKSSLNCAKRSKIRRKNIRDDSLQQLPNGDSLSFYRRGNKIGLCDSLWTTSGSGSISPCFKTYSKEDKKRRLKKLLNRADTIIAHVNGLMRLNVDHQSGKNGNDDGLLAPTAINSSENDKWAAQHTYAIINCHLRPHQVTGVQWLLGLYSSGVNGILADEMGLGKTLQVLSALSRLRDQGASIGPHLVVMPLSVLSSWQNEINKYASPGMFVVHMHLGCREAREKAFNDWQRELKHEIKRSPASLNTKRIFICLTTYNFAISDNDIFKKLRYGYRSKVSWNYMIVDEAHRLKNCESKLFGSLLALKSKHHLLLTGTPLQNNLRELWSLLHFVLPQIFSDFDEFSDWFNHPFDPLELCKKRKNNPNMNEHDEVQMEENQNLTEEEKAVLVKALHRVLRPFMLRRVKTDVAELPPKIEKIVCCPFSALQDHLYFELALKRSACHDDIFRAEMESSFKYNSGGIANMNCNNLVMQLRKTCNHPYLVLEDIKSIPDELYFRDLLGSSGKLVVLNKLLDQLLPSGHKILLFSQMTTMLDIIQGFLQSKCVACYRLDGSTCHNERNDMMRNFNESNDNAISVFLLSTRAGGVGINLQAADTVILFDSDWNPQQDLQAISRSHRIGQNKPVLVLRLVSVFNSRLRNSPCKRFLPPVEFATIEERMLERAKIKLAAEKTIISEGNLDMASGRSAQAETKLQDTIEIIDFSNTKNDSGNLLLYKACARDMKCKLENSRHDMGLKNIHDPLQELITSLNLENNSNGVGEWADWLKRETDIG